MLNKTVGAEKMKLSIEKENSNNEVDFVYLTFDLNTNSARALFRLNVNIK